MSYGYFQRAARVGEHAVAPLIEMAKIVAGLSARQSSAAGGDAVSGSAMGLVVSGRRAALREPLSLDAGYLASLGPVLDAEIRARLHTSALSAETSSALQSLQECIRFRVDVCLPLLNPAIEWYEAALARTRSSRRGRAIVGVSLAKLYAFSGQLDQAVRHARQATSNYRDNVGIRREEGLLYLAIDNFAEAERVMRELDALRPNLPPYWRSWVPSVLSELSGVYASKRALPADLARFSRQDTDDGT